MQKILFRSRKSIALNLGLLTHSSRLDLLDPNESFFCLADDYRKFSRLKAQMAQLKVQI
jgi:hypothetical protein